MAATANNLTGYVPPPPRKSSSLSYDNSCYHALEQIQLTILWRSLFLTWALLSVSSFWWQGFGGSLFRLLWPNIPLAILAFLTGVAPLVLAQRLTAKPRKVGYPTLGAHLRALSTEISTWRVLALYLISAVSFAICLVFAAPPSTRISVFKSTKLYPWHLNERFVFLLGSNILLAFTYTADVLLGQKWAVQWTLSQDITYWNLTYARIQSDVTESAKLSFISSCVFIASYLASRRRFFGLLVYIAKPFVYNFVRSRLWGLSYSLAARLVLLNLATVMLWKFVQTSISVRMGQPKKMAVHTSNTVDTLLSGITSRASNGYYQQFAIHELADIAQDPKGAPRRKAIFTDLRNPSSASAWSVICRELLLVLGKDYQTLLNKGKAPAPAPAPPAIAAPPKPSLANTPRTPSALRKAELAPLQRSPTERLFDGFEYSLSTADVALNQIPKIIDQGKQSVSGLSRSLSGRFGSGTGTSTTPTSSTAVVPVANSQSLLQRLASPITSLQSREIVKNYVPAPARAVVMGVKNAVGGLVGVFGKETDRRKMEMALPNIARDVWAAKAIGHFTAASFTEDPYGLVQRDIPKILEALLLFREALKEYKVEMGTTECDDWTKPLNNALIDSSHVIHLTFRDRLSAFKFPPRIAKLLTEATEIR